MRTTRRPSSRPRTGDTVVTGRSVDAPVRCLRNQMTNAYIAKEKEGADRMELEHFTLGGLRKAVFDGDVKTGSVMAGQVAGMLHEIKPLRQIFEGDDRRMRRDAEKAGGHGACNPASCRGGYHPPAYPLVPGMKRAGG